MSTPEPPSTLTLRLVGTAQAEAGSRRLSLERKAAGALAWLALRGPVARQRLATVLWPDASADGARNNLRQLIFKLKKALDTAVIEGQEELHLPAEVRIDLDGEPLLAGCVYNDCPELAAWVDEARTAHQQKIQQTRTQAADEALAAGDVDLALTLARALVAEDELSEPAHLRLVQALYLRGERAAALEAAARCEALLNEALGVAPSAEMLDLVALVRRAETPAVAPRAIPLAVLKPPRLIGRSRELAMLAQAGMDSQVPLLLGEPGLGKSRLLAEVCDAVPGLQLLGARPGDAAVPFASLARWLRELQDGRPEALAALPPALHHLLPDRAPAPAQARTGRLDLNRAMTELLQRARAAGLNGLALDDLHFADAATLETVQTLMAEPALSDLHWLLARRPAEGDVALDRLADLLVDDGRLAPLTLQPLDAAGITELIESLGLPGLDGAALVPDLLRSTGGNPMFVLETIKALLVQPTPAGQALPRPTNVGALIERRLRQLSPPAQSLARVAALAGPDFSTDLAMAVLQVPLMALADAWAELESAQVLRDSAFAHDLIYEATLASVPVPIRRHARRAIAEFLAPLDVEPTRLAEHWLVAGLPERAAPHFEAAGRRAEAATRYVEAQTLFERAADGHAQAGQPEKALDVLLALADLLDEAGQLEMAEKLLASLDKYAGNTDARIRLLMQRMHNLGWMNRHAEAVKLGQEALADPDLCDEATPVRLAQLRYQLADNLRFPAGPADALVQLQLAEPQLGTIDDAQWRGWFQGLYSAVLQQMGEIALAAPRAASALEAARAAGRRRMVAGRLQVSARIAQASGQMVQALDHIDEGLLLMADTGGEDTYTRAARVQRGGLLLALGRYGEALDMLEEGAQGCTHMYDRDRALVDLCELWALLGQPARLQAALDRAGGMVTDVRMVAGLSRVRIEAQWLAGHVDRDEVQRFLTEHGQDHQVPLLKWRFWPERIDMTEVSACRTQWASRGLLGHVAMADVTAAQAAWRRGDAAAAASWAAQALPAQRQSLGSGAYRPWVLMEIARCAAPADPELAHRAWLEGTDWVRNVARFQVPEPFRDSFLTRNAINRELLAMPDPGRR